MVEYITWLKALAALLITNSHMEGIYPVASLASGGLLGNLLFFAVSGFCLYNIRKPFLPWYGRRLWRIYPAVWIMTILGVMLGIFSLEEWRHVLKLFFYPTGYHFIAAILLLYIPFYFVARIANRSQRPVRFLFACGGVLAALYAVCYLTFFDFSYYHIDNVLEPMLFFCYAASMLMGASFCASRALCPSSSHRFSLLLFCVAVVLYFCTKIGAGCGSIPPSFQFVNQMSILFLLYSVLRCGDAFNSLLERAPAFMHRTSVFFASITLELYLVQWLIIDGTSLVALPFPLNMLLLILCVILSAWGVHVFINRLNAFVPLRKN